MEKKWFFRKINFLKTLSTLNTIIWPFYRRGGAHGLTDKVWQLEESSLLKYSSTIHFFTCGTASLRSRKTVATAWKTSHYYFFHLYYIATGCLCAWWRPISSGTAGPIWLNLFLLAPSWSRDGFRPKKFRIQDPDPGGTKSDHLEGVKIELWCMNQNL